MNKCGYRRRKRGGINTRIHRRPTIHGVHVTQSHLFICSLSFFFFFFFLQRLGGIRVSFSLRLAGWIMSELFLFRLVLYITTPLLTIE
jgi:hypothetical protein